jgi:hypothetical protein
MNSLDARDLSHELSLRADYIARRLLGNPNRKARGLQKKELRYGNHGSLRVHTVGPKRGHWNDFESGEHGDLLDLISREQGCPLPEACDIACDLLGLSREGPSRPLKVRPKPPPVPEPESEADRIRNVLRIWDEAEPIIGTAGELYFIERFKGRVDLNEIPDLHEVLRWHPKCPWGENGARHPCLVALWTTIRSNVPRAIHRRPIGPAGEKLDRWKALGPSADCCISVVAR